MALQFIRNRVSRFKSQTLYLFRDWLEGKVNARWHNYPLGREPKADRGTYLRLAEEMSQKTYQEIDIFEQETGYAIDKEWLHDLALHTQIVIKKSPLCYAHGRVLYSALSRYLAINRGSDSAAQINIWETGSARGFSTLCMAKALADQDRAGTILTFDVLPHRTRMYWNCIDDFDGPKTREELLSPWQELMERYLIFHQGSTRIEMPKMKTARIHFAFLDGSHTYEDVWFEFNLICPHQQLNDMIVFDDYTPEQYPGLVRAVDEICDRHDYRRIDIKAHGRRGYVVAEKHK